MGIYFQRTLQKSLDSIKAKDYKELEIHPHQIIRTNNPNNSSQIIEVYGNAKWAVVDLLNEQYSKILKNKFDLYNWLHHNENDEVAYFLNEAGSNCLNYSEFKAPSTFHLWLGENGFLIGIEQQGRGFNAVKIDENKIKENEGAAFNFFRNCKGKVFFDDGENAKIIYFECLLKK